MERLTTTRTHLRTHMRTRTRTRVRIYTSPLHVRKRVQKVWRAYSFSRRIITTQQQQNQHQQQQLFATDAPVVTYAFEAREPSLRGVSEAEKNDLTAGSNGPRAGGLAGGYDSVQRRQIYSPSGLLTTTRQMQSKISSPPGACCTAVVAAAASATAAVRDPRC